MIVPMNKVTVVVMDKEKETSLEKLRELGVLHLEQKPVQSEALSRLIEKKARTEAALGLIKSLGTPGKKKNIPAAPGLFAEGEDRVEAVLALGEGKKNLQEQLSSLTRDRIRLEKWGDFDPGDFAYLAEKGIVLVPYELSPQDYEKHREDAAFIVLGREKTLVRVLAVGGEIAGEAPLTFPDLSLSAIDKRRGEIQGEVAKIDQRIAACLSELPEITAEYTRLLERIEFETARAGMDVLQEDQSGGEDFHGRTVSWITGYMPQDRIGILKRGAAENGWAFLADEPGPDDPVPTLLKNNKFVNLLRPLTDFLEVVPGYNEVDISLWFLLFFVIFFGMIFGDAGYGALLLLGGIGGSIVTAKKGVPVGFKFLCLLGFSNFIWGVLTCSWFGIEIKYLPEGLKNISLPLISNVTSNASDYGKKIVQQNLMIFCFSLALLQLSIGHIIAIFRNRSLKALGELGSIAMLGGMYFIILSLIASNEARQIPLYPLAVYAFAGGFLLNFIFVNYDGSIGRSALESLKNIIPVILGIANVFSDIMSYIRLWAVGLAGAAIADTVDKMAGPLLGHFLFFVLGVILLVFGHGLNIILNVLSVLVHGVRLNTLEFSGHAGVSWAGFAYRPFSKHTIR
ncbi:MAG: V-type ATP synthase subunit I [Spirochaetaceae bacterium]|jgi:V/A-type H+-transporting ATPase subunit I|nr:V-type ATP synthase subunit I [Spirochaetaceae bacterium]